MSKKNYLSKYMNNNKLNFVLGNFFSILKASFNIFFAFLMEIVMNFALSDNLDKLPFILMLSIVSIVFYGVSIYLKMLFQNRFYYTALVQYKDDLYDKVISKDLTSFRQKNVGNYLSIMTNDVNSIELNFLENIFMLPEQLFLLFGSLVAMVFTSWFFFLIIIVSALFPMLSTLIYNKKIKLQEEKISMKNEHFLATVKDMLSGFTVIKSFNIENEVVKLYKNINGSLEHSKLEKRKMLSVVATASESSSIILFIVVFLAGSIFTIKGYLEIGVVVAFIQLINYIIEPVGKLPQIINKINASKFLIDKANGIIDEEKGLQKEKRVLTKFEDKIRIKDVSFSYSEKAVLDGVNITFEKGKSYALVGVSGSGKSTLLNLLMGYYDNYNGSIKIDDLELSDIDRQTLYQFVSVIQQDVFIFDDNIISNITMYREFSKEKIDDALQKSGLLKLIEQKGVDYNCGENGNRLSGGEKQRISIARCLLKETPILLLDEAMSALDNATSKQVEESILSMDNLTRIVITHKLSEDMLRKYNEIVTLKDGKIVEVGSFDELMEKKGMFYSIYNVSF